jgi:hypothetical protein
MKVCSRTPNGNPEYTHVTGKEVEHLFDLARSGLKRRKLQRYRNLEVHAVSEHKVVFTLNGRTLDAREVTELVQLLKDSL